MKLYIEDMQSSECTTEAKDNDVVDYLKRLVPEDQEQAIIRPSLPSNVVSFSSLKALSLVEQCKLLLKDGNPQLYSYYVCNYYYYCPSQNNSFSTIDDVASGL